MPAKTATPAELRDPAAAAAFAAGIAGLVLDGYLSVAAGRQWVDTLRADRHYEAAEVLAVACKAAEHRALLRVLPGGNP